jgi:hypothetical protein
MDGMAWQTFHRSRSVQVHDEKADAKSSTIARPRPVLLELGY